MSRAGLGDMVSAGGRAISRYTGTLFAVFVVETLVATACALTVALLLALELAHNPLFDEAVDGDAVALITCIHSSPGTFVAIICMVIGALLIWQLASWFLAGGLYAVFDRRPDGRREVARVFGGGGAATYLTYVRLAFCSLPGLMLTVFVWTLGLGIAGHRIVYALTTADWLVPLALASLPALIIGHIVGTTAEYARVELSLRYSTHSPAVISTYFRALAFVLRRPLALAHAALAALAWIAITCVYAYIAQGHAMFGAEGALVLWVIRLGVSLARTAVRFGAMAGQVELTRTRPLPARRDADSDA